MYEEKTLLPKLIMCILNTHCHNIQHSTVSSLFIAAFDSLNIIIQIICSVSNYYVQTIQFWLTKKDQIIRVIRSGIWLYWLCCMFLLKEKQSLILNHYKELVHKSHALGKQTTVVAIYFITQIWYISVLNKIQFSVSKPSVDNTNNFRSCFHRT